MFFKPLWKRGQESGQYWKIAHAASQTELLKGKKLFDFAMERAEEDWRKDYHFHAFEKCIVFAAHFILGYTGMRVYYDDPGLPKDAPVDILIEQATSMLEQQERGE